MDLSTNIPEEDAGGKKKSRLNRPVSACETCRKLKTRCESVSGKKACRRCISLGIVCDLPGTDKGLPLEGMASFNDVDTKLASIEQKLEGVQNQISIAPEGIDARLAQLERSVEELGRLIRGAVHPSLSVHAISRPQQDTQHMPGSSTSVYLDDTVGNGIMRPVLLMRNLQTQFFGPKQDFSDEVLALGNVVSAGIIRASLSRHLIQMQVTSKFIKHYGFWISVNHKHDLPDDFERNHPLLFSTACLLASRFVPSIGRTASHEIYLMVRRLASSVVLKPPPLRYEELQGLLLLSMFSPTIQTAMPIDSWLMSALGINHATLHLNRSVDMILPGNSDYMLLPKLRIWNALCLTHIQRSMVQKKFVDYCYDILETPKSCFEDVKLSAEVLLYWETAHLLNQKQRMDESENPIFDELAEWKLSWKQVFDNPRSVTVRFSYMFCYLLLYRVSLRAQTSSIILKDAALKVSREILEVFQELDFTVILDLPDYYFFITVYAALTLCKFTISDPLIAMTQESLIDLAPNNEHIAFRFGTVLQEIRQKAAAAGTSVMNQTNREIGIDGLTSNEHYAWDVFMAAYYPRNMDTLDHGLDGTLLSDETQF
ncbi:hypothetical protein BGW36DRAFT_432254 [Talaromyces proteolyticus]|uniref:Transcriptional activator of proteases prtT n=1 Tax=Talaromyces proteolyticus TaxID=1131652 RepID=A0AAD4KIY7_9EURO|nr:uncharacterized protein BGW36DRAFT_432254 [Talaromyces proteolyticus]KAH8690452.1 hypothetical protein BGW36DRAFT_432254 [Talaromyces proteolyticus]